MATEGKTWKQFQIREWSTDDVVVWISSLSISEPWKKQLTTPILQNEISGKDLYPLKNGSALMGSLGIINLIACNRVFSQLKTIKDKEVEEVTRRAATATPQNNQQDAPDNEKQFDLHLIHRGTEFKLDQYCTLNTYIMSIKQWYKAQSGVSSSLNQIDLYYRGKKIDCQKLSDIQPAFNTHHHLINIKFDNNGGAAPSKAYLPTVYDEDPNRERVIRFSKYKSLRRSEKDDCLTFFDDESGYDRADIGCKGHHAMAAITMFKYIVQVVEINQKNTKFHCPICKDKLDWEHIAQIADLTSQEYARFTRILDRRKNPHIKSCPNCGAESTKKKGTVIFQMACASCNGPYWCWVCCQKWRGKGTTWCGNDDCALVTETNLILDKAEIITPKYLNCAKVPEIRACPRCMTLINWKDGCKMMTCSGCSEKFCFVCLKLQGKTESYKPREECEPKPRQIFK
eukprot:CAMPEP_0202713852 /NCGR_PEP_ID=MMETSP1385-20130828/60443_1 /ASSEMBLY_ACC=CAM_ASM_000861 /TAXON_ID=933848 /ORGANISM="Elphidium margaritaceum" /LENGTH=455 /DNA_ID=CAMNT_0049374371 /DNA_START=78 /DNA_END=1445 /DNA_ORIENTATION=-